MMGARWSPEPAPADGPPSCVRPAVPQPRSCAPTPEGGHAGHSRRSRAVAWRNERDRHSTGPRPRPGRGAARASVVVGPFRWTPAVQGQEFLLMSVSAKGDLSNADAASLLPCAAGPTPVAQLVPFDNNIVVREVAPIHGPEPCGVELEPIDAQCI